MRIIVFVLSVIFLLAAPPAEASYKEGIAAYKKGDYETARATLQPVAEAGDSRAQLAMGLINHKGLGGTKDLKSAIKWYRQAADQGNKTAENNLGIMYRRGEGVEKDLQEAFALIWAAAIQGHPRAELNLSDMYQKGEGTPKHLMMAYVWLEFAITDLPESGRHAANSRRAELISQMKPENITRADQMAKALRKARE
jgi:uncharacterized protein